VATNAPDTTAEAPDMTAAEAPNTTAEAADVAAAKASSVTTEAAAASSAAASAAATGIGCDGEKGHGKEQHRGNADAGHQHRSWIFRSCWRRLSRERVSVSSRTERF
jgi:hypothetical protein